jgi:predicted GH43/DUF377 family glycosyl hydrolase
MMKTRVFTRSQHNPIISPLDLPFPAAAVLNPGVTEHDDEVVLLLRVEDHAGHSNIHIARSKNGVTDWKIESEPILRYGEKNWRYEQWGCEDPRVTYLAEEKRWYITYTAYSPNGAAVALACSDDLIDVERIGLIFSPNNKDAVLFPKKINNRWAVLHRPDAGGMEHIWSAPIRLTWCTGVNHTVFCRSLVVLHGMVPKSEQDHLQFLQNTVGC